MHKCSLAPHFNPLQLHGKLCHACGRDTQYINHQEGWCQVVIGNSFTNICTITDQETTTELLIILLKYSFPKRLHYSNVWQHIDSKYTDYHKIRKAKAAANSLLSPCQFRVICHAKGRTRRGFTWVCIQEKLQSLGPNPGPDGRKAGGLKQLRTTRDWTQSLTKVVFSLQEETVTSTWKGTA